MRNIRITGQGLLKTAPDTTRLTMTLSGLFPQYEDALAHSVKDSETLKNTIVPLGFSKKDLKTLSFNIEATTSRIVERFADSSYLSV